MKIAIILIVVIVVIALASLWYATNKSPSIIGKWYDKNMEEKNTPDTK